MTVPTIGVCGFGRCGSTMAMAMLKAGGVPFVDGSHPDSGELRYLGPDTLAAVSHGGAVKLLDWVLRDELPPADWRFIWLDRDPREQAKSTAKFIGSFGFDDIDEDVLAASYNRDRPRALGLLRALGPVLVLQYEWVLARPKKYAHQIAMFLATNGRALAVARPGELWFDVRAAAAVVHQRDGRCRPDLAVELARDATGASSPE